MSRSTRALATVSAAAAIVVAGAAMASAKQTATTPYDHFDDGGASYGLKWQQSFGPLELAAGGTQSFAGGAETVTATPFTTSADFSVFDHLKYFAQGPTSVPVPAKGSVTFASTIRARTPGVQSGRVVHGTYVQSGLPYSAPLMDSQQAGVVMNVVDFCTGQLFDWFVTETTAAPLIERLPSNVTGNTSNPACPGAKHVGRDLMHTQFIDEFEIAPDRAHRVEITYDRKPGGATVEYVLDGKTVARVKDPGVPLDRQGRQPFAGTYPSLGPGEEVDDQIRSLTLAHGLFSLVDPFPFQHPEAPELAVSIPASERTFGQGAAGTWDDFDVTVRK
jgi:hypothetical protein